jgi:hypothetical protein
MLCSLSCYAPRGGRIVKSGCKGAGCGGTEDKESESGVQVTVQHRTVYRESCSREVNEVGNSSESRDLISAESFT